MTVTNVADLLRAAAAARADDIALRFPRGPRGDAGWDELTFRELDTEADHLARGFVGAGLSRKRVLLALKPGPGFYAVSFGLLRAGAVPVFLDPGMDRRMMLDCVARIAPEAVIGVPAAVIARHVLRGTFRSVTTTITAGPIGLGGPTLVSLRRKGFDPTIPLPEVSLDDDAVLVFTSGSTGHPKAVAQPHRTMIARVERIQDLLGLRPGDTVVETLLVYTVLELCMGLTVVVPPMDVAKPATVDPRAVLATLDRFRPRLVSASPVVWQRLVRHAAEVGARPEGVEMLLTTAAPIPVDLHARLQTLFGPQVELFTPYGATEAMPVSMVGSRTILDETGARTAAGEGVCVGPRADGMEIRIARTVDGPIPTMADADLLPPGEIGEILVRGDGVSPAYRSDDRANAEAKVADDGGTWHRMGDLGWLDDQDRLWFCGRVRHRVETAAGTIPAVCAEGVFNAHPAVFRAAIVGTGPAGAQRVTLFIELEPGHTASDALAAEIRAMADGTRYAGVVDTIRFHPGFPVDTRHNSKIRREDLAAELA